MTFSQLLAQPVVSETVTVKCVGNGVAGEAMGTAKWEGVCLKHLLERPGVRSETIVSIE